MARPKSVRPRKKSVRMVKGAEFFKVFIPQSHPSSDPQLSIPPDYVKNFKRTIKEKVILKNINGKEWHVDVKETPSGVFLQNGWKKFIDYHGLKVGEFLVFRYVGSYSFMVKIFGPNGCKKVTLEPKDTDVKSEDESDEEMKEEQTSRKRASPQTDDDFSSSEGRTEHSDRSTEVNEEQEDASEESDNSKKSEYDEGPFFIQPPRGSKAIPIKLLIPSKLIERYNLSLQKYMTLCNAAGMEWPVHIFTYSGQSLGQGLHLFQKENDVGPDDSCKYTFSTDRSNKKILVEVIRSKKYRGM